jgi:hypothetical protein
MAEFNGALYLQHGNGRVDCFDGQTWMRNVCALSGQGRCGV